MSRGGDRARDHDDRGGDHSHTKPFERKPGHQYARNYPDPLTGHPLQIYPTRGSSEFDSFDDFLTHLDAVSRYNNGLAPKRPLPEVSQLGDDVQATAAPRSASGRRALRSRHVGIRLNQRDFGLLEELARSRAVPPGTMARMLIVRAVRAAAEDAK